MLCLKLRLKERNESGNLFSFVLIRDVSFGFRICAHLVFLFLAARNHLIRNNRNLLRVERHRTREECAAKLLRSICRSSGSAIGRCPVVK